VVVLVVVAFGLKGHGAQVWPRRLRFEGLSMLISGLLWLSRTHFASSQRVKYSALLHPSQLKQLSAYPRQHSSASQAARQAGESPSRKSQTVTCFIARSAVVCVQRSKVSPSYSRADGSSSSGSTVHVPYWYGRVAW
jgi:hypothetical protein